MTKKIKVVAEVWYTERALRTVFAEAAANLTAAGNVEGAEIANRLGDDAAGIATRIGAEFAPRFFSSLAT